MTDKIEMIIGTLVGIDLLLTVSFAVLLSVMSDLKGSLRREKLNSKYEQEQKHLAWQDRDKYNLMLGTLCKATGKTVVETGQYAVIDKEK